MKFTDEDKRIISSVLANGRAKQEKNERFAIIDFDSFYKLFDDQERSIERYLAINPSAARFRFFESYPKNNDIGMMYEP